MGWLTWLRGVRDTAVEVVRAEARAAEGLAEAPWPPHIEQQARIMRQAEVYRRQFQADAAAQRVAEAKQEAARNERARREYEDDVAVGLAMGWGHFPQDRHGPSGPRVLSFEEWGAMLQREAEDKDWGNRR